MQEFDLIVVGGGSGSQVGAAAADRGWNVAVVEPGPLGGACVTRGCVPSKALIHHGTLAEGVRRANEFGLDTELAGVDFDAITTAIRDTVYEKADNQAESVREDDNRTLYDGEGQFVDERTLAVDGYGERIYGEHVIVAAGSRPLIPPIDGLDDVDYLTSTDALWLDSVPDELVVLGGGYIAAEMGHVYGALGADVAFVERSDELLSGEDRAISETVTEAFGERYDVYTGHTATEATQDDGRISLRAEPDDDEAIEVSGDELLVAAGRGPNTDRLDVEAAGIETDDGGYVETDEYLEATAENVWALGDIIGQQPFKHAADHEARHVAMNLLDDAGREVTYDGMAHAVFTSPQAASLGHTEGELKDAGTDYEAATYPYTSAPLGMIERETEGVVKVLAAPDGEILGCHIVGREASSLIHEVSVALANGADTAADIATTIHIHPALNEAVLGAFDEIANPQYSTAPDWSDVSME